MKKKEQYTVQLDPEFVEKLDKLAEKLELSRSRLMQNLLQTAYDDAAKLDKLGLIPAVLFMRNVKEYKDKLFKEMNIEKED